MPPAESERAEVTELAGAVESLTLRWLERLRSLRGPMRDMMQRMVGGGQCCR